MTIVSLEPFNTVLFVIIFIGIVIGIVTGVIMFKRLRYKMMLNFNNRYYNKKWPLFVEVIVMLFPLFACGCILLGSPLFFLIFILNFIWSLFFND